MELWQHRATQPVALIAARQVSCREVMEAHLDPIDAATNGQLNAIIIVLGEAALADADGMDRACHKL